MIWPFQRRNLIPSQCVADLKDPRKRVRVRAANALANVDALRADAGGALIGALYDPDDEVKKAAALALGRLGEQASDALPRLVELICEYRMCLGRVVGQLGGPAVPHAMRLLTEADHFAFVEGLYAVTELGPRAANARSLLHQLRERNANDLAYSLLIDDALASIDSGGSHRDAQV